MKDIVFGLLLWLAMVIGGLFIGFFIGEKLDGKYTCHIENIEGTYTTKSLQGDLTVFERDGRVFMFPNHDVECDE